MLISEQAPPQFWLAAAIVFVLQTHVYLFGAPPFQMGLWPTQEPRLLALLLISVLSCGWFFYGRAMGWLALPRPFPLYLSLILAWIGWQVIVTATVATSPWRSWFGSGMYGEGTAYYICVGLMTFMAYGLWPHPRYRRVMLYAVLTALVGMMLLQQLPEATGWRPLLWPDYLAFLTGYVWVVLLLSKHDIPVRIQLGLAILACECLVISKNQSAWLLLPLAAIALLLCLRVQEKSHGAPLPRIPTWARGLATALCFLPLVYTFQTLTPSADQNNSIEERVHMNAVGANALFDAPARLLAGKGWDNFANDHFRYAVFESVRLFYDGQYKPNTVSIFGTSAHPHNQPLEALLALGIPGIALWFALAIIVLWRLPDTWFWRMAPIHVALVMISYFWFPLSFFGAFVALYWAALTHAQQPAHAADTRKGSFASLLFLPLAFVLLVSSWQQFRAMTYGEWLKKVIHAPYQPYKLEAFLEDVPRGGARLHAIISDYLDQLVSRESYEHKIANHYSFRRSEYETYERLLRKTPDGPQWVARLVEISQRLSKAPSVDVHVGGLDLVVPYFLLLYAKDPAYDIARAMAFETYPEAILRAAAQAPRREDLSTPYLYHLEQAGESKILADFVTQLLAINPNHRVARWLKGKQLAKNKATKQEGLALMRGALNAQVDKIYPIPYKERWEIIWQTGNDVLSSLPPQR